MVLDNIGDSFPSVTHNIPPVNISTTRVNPAGWVGASSPIVHFYTPSTIPGNGTPLGSNSTNMGVWSDSEQSIVFKVRNTLISNFPYGSANNMSMFIATYDVWVDAVVAQRCIVSTKIKSGSHRYGLLGEPVTNPGLVICNLIYPGHPQFQMTSEVGSTAERFSQDERFVDLSVGINTFTVNFIFYCELTHWQVQLYQLGERYLEEAQVEVKILPESVPSLPSVTLAGRNPINYYSNFYGDCTSISWSRILNRNEKNIEITGIQEPDIAALLISPVSFFLLSTAVDPIQLNCGLYTYNNETFAALYSPPFLGIFPSFCRLLQPHGLSTQIYCQYLILDIGTGAQYPSRVITW